MINDKVIREVIAQCRLDTTVDHARDVVTKVQAAVEELSANDRNTLLLLLERVILKPQGGHKVTVKYGHSDAANNPGCIVCRRPVSDKDISVRIISRWENSQYWLAWHPHCVEGSEMEIDIDILDGRVSSSVGLT